MRDLEAFGRLPVVPCVDLFWGINKVSSYAGEKCDNCIRLSASCKASSLGLFIISAGAGAKEASGRLAVCIS